MTNIDDVARASGVSTATVSRALRGLPHVAPETREAVADAARRLGYVASASARALATGRGLAVGAVVSNVSHWFSAAVLEGVASELHDADYDTLLLRPGGDERDGPSGPGSLEAQLGRRQADGLLVLSSELSAAERRLVVGSGRPAAGVGARMRGLPFVGIDEAAAAALAVAQLLAHGHRRIAVLGGLDEPGAGRRVAERRRAGMLRVLRAHGLESSGCAGPCAWGVEAGHAAAARLLRAADPPTAVAAVADELALGALLAARELGIEVPRRLSIVGVDDHPLAAAFGLTTVRQDAATQGRLAARLVLDELAGGHVVSHRLPAVLVDRGTVAAA